MPPDRDHRVPLNVVSVRLGNDHLPSGDIGLPATYSVLLGLSRRLTAYEHAELVDPSIELVGTGDLMWLAAPQTTIEVVKERLPQIQDLLRDAVKRADPVEQAGEALAAGERDELQRRMILVGEINRSLAPFRSQPGGAAGGVSASE